MVNEKQELTNNNNSVQRRLNQLENPTVRDFLDEVDTLATTYLEKLPPVNSECKLIIVIPVYNEGKIFETLVKTLCTMQTVDNSEYEVIVIINNPTGQDAKNRYTIEQLIALNAKNLIIIDATSGQLSYQSKGHLGLVRGLGTEIARKRLAQTNKGSDGVIAWLDGDVKVTTTYVQSLLNSYSNSNVRCSTTLLNVFGENRDATSIYIGTARANLKSCLNKANTGVFNNISGGPQLSFRASIVPEVIETFVAKSSDEDYALSLTLANRTDYTVNPYTNIYVAHRYRLEGYDANMIAFKEKNDVDVHTLQAAMEKLSIQAIDVTEENTDYLEKSIVSSLAGFPNIITIFKVELDRIKNDNNIVINRKTILSALSQTLARYLLLP